MNRRVLSAGLIVAVPFLGILFANLGRDPHAVASPLIGRPAPPFALTQVEGGAPVELQRLRGAPVVLNFWATWCVPCIEEHGTLVRAAAQRGSEVHFLGLVYDDDAANIKSFLAERGRAYPSLMDPGGRTAIAYGVFGVPETYFIDAAGTIVAKFTGPLDPKTFDSHLQKALGGEKALAGTP
jgi:cytochrome c biogenesis protein CcmG/thiol:disulfide interchange protein DsbE